MFIIIKRFRIQSSENGRNMPKFFHILGRLFRNNADTIIILRGRKCPCNEILTLQLLYQLIICPRWQFYFFYEFSIQRIHIKRAKWRQHIHCIFFFFNNGIVYFTILSGTLSLFTYFMQKMPFFIKRKHSRNPFIDNIISVIFYNNFYRPYKKGTIIGFQWNDRYFRK